MIHTHPSASSTSMLYAADRHLSHFPMNHFIFPAKLEKFKSGTIFCYYIFPTCFKTSYRYLTSKSGDGNYLSPSANLGHVCTKFGRSRQGALCADAVYDILKGTMAFCTDCTYPWVICAANWRNSVPISECSSQGKIQEAMNST